MSESGLKRSWKGFASVIAKVFNTKPSPYLQIGDYVLMLQLDNKHEIAYNNKNLAGIPDVDVAIAQKLLRAGDVALDLGANIGYVALHMLRLGASEIHAFEPNPEIFKRLKQLRAPRLHCYPFAIGDKAGQGELILSVSHHQGSTLYPQVVTLRRKVYGNAPRAVKVEIRSIDETFPRKSFDYVKVDIEGGELDFVRGAKAMLEIRPPRVLVLEIKPEFKHQYLAALAPYFSCALRVDYDKTNGTIKFVNPDVPEQAPYRNQPPNYVFTNDPQLFK